MFTLTHCAVATAATSSSARQRQRCTVRMWHYWRRPMASRCWAPAKCARPMATGTTVCLWSVVHICRTRMIRSSMRQIARAVSTIQQRSHLVAMCWWLRQGDDRRSSSSSRRHRVLRSTRICCSVAISWAYPSPASRAGCPRISGNCSRNKPSCCRDEHLRSQPQWSQHRQQRHPNRSRMRSQQRQRQRRRRQWFPPARNCRRKRKSSV